MNKTGTTESGRTDEPVVLVMDDGYGVVDEVYGPFPSTMEAAAYGKSLGKGRVWCIRRLRPTPESAEESTVADRGSCGECSTWGRLLFADERVLEEMREHKS